MSWKRLLLFIIAAIVLGGTALFGALAGGVIAYRLMRQNEPVVVNQPSATTAAVVPVTTTVQTLTVNTIDVETAITEAVQNVGPAVVTVVATVPGQQTFFGYSGDSTSTGSGIFISSDGYILTNNHVIEGGKSYQIIYSDGSQNDASLVGTDQYSDLAGIILASI